MPDMISGHITFHNLHTKYRLPEKKKIRQWIKNAALSEGFQVGNIAFILCLDQDLLAVNQTYLNHDTLTDIITFDYSEGNEINGDIYISIDRIQENARTYQNLVLQELHRVIIHGIMHLCGYEDKRASEKLEMTDKEDYYLSLRSF